MSFSELKAQRSLYDKLVSILVQAAKENYEHAREMAEKEFNGVFTLLALHADVKPSPELFFALNRIKRKTLIAKLAGGRQIVVDPVARVDLAYIFARNARKSLPVREAEEVVFFDDQG